MEKAMKEKKVTKIFAVALLAIGLPVVSTTATLAQDAGAATNYQSKDATLTQGERITNKDLNKAIRTGYRVNSPLIRQNATDISREVNSPYLDDPYENDPLRLRDMFIDLGPNKTFDALGNSPVNNNSGAYNPRQSVNMPQSTITQPPLPYKSGGTYYQANDSLLRPPKDNW